MPEDSVRPETQTLVTLTRRKEWAGILEIFIFKLFIYFKYKNKNAYKIESYRG